MAAGISKLILLSTAAAAGGGIAASNFGFSPSGEKEVPKDIKHPEEKKEVTPEPEEAGKCFIFVTDEAKGGNNDRKITKVLQKFENIDTFLNDKRTGNSSGFSKEVEDACGDKKKNVKSGKDTHVYVYQDSQQKWIYSQYVQKDWVNTAGIDISKIEVKS